METFDPNLSEHQFAVLHALSSTGHVLKKHYSLFFSGDNINEVYSIFDSYNEAKEYVINQVEDNEKIECWIRNSENKAIFFYDKDGGREL